MIALIAFLLLLFAGFLSILFLGLYGLYRGSHKRKMEDAKLRTESLRAQRLERDLAVVENRAIKLSNDIVKEDLQIEMLRMTVKAMGGHVDAPIIPADQDPPVW